ncbi:uroplakin-2 [Discoglossus pictus]
MQPLGIVTGLLLISIANAQLFNTSLASGLIRNPLTKTAIIALPGCVYAGNQAVLTVKNATAVVSNQNFSVPQCRLKRDVVVVSNSLSGNVETSNVGFRVQGLAPNTNYMAQYFITLPNGTTASSSVYNFTTLKNDTVPEELMARSGGMVVITVLLSIAMFLLIVGLIVVLAMTGRKK